MKCPQCGYEGEPESICGCPICGYREEEPEPEQERNERATGKCLKITVTGMNHKSTPRESEGCQQTMTGLLSCG